jgi:hypothetical protein
MKTATIISKAFVVLVLAAMATPVFSQNKKDSPADEKQKQFVELSKTNENHKLLAGMTGTWSFEGKHIFPDPAMKPFEFRGTIIKKSLLGGRYFITETTSNGKMKMPWSEGELVTYSDMTIEGYDNITKKFVAANIANETNTGIITYEGSYDPITKTITYEAQSATHMHKDIAPGTMMKFRELVKIIDNDHFILEHHESIGGKEIIVTELKYARIKSELN